MQAMFEASDAGIVRPDLPGRLAAHSVQWTT